MRATISIIIVALVVILSCGMLLPKLMTVREDQARVYCMNNLMNLSKALYKYHEQYDAFPRAVAAGSGLPPEKRVSWLVEPLPYLKQDQLAALVDRRAGWEAPENAAALRTGVPWFHCYAITNPKKSPNENHTYYVGLTGLGPDAARLPLDHERAGCFGERRDVSISYLKEWDGTSATLMILETANDLGPWLAGGPPTARGLDPARQPYLGPQGQFGRTHPAGNLGMYADGSVRMHAPAMNPRVLEALVTIGGTAEGN